MLNCSYVQKQPLGQNNKFSLLLHCKQFLGGFFPKYFHQFVFIRPFEKRDVLWEHLRRAASTAFPLSKSKSFHPIFIKLGEYVGGHNISVKFDNQPNPPGTPELWPFNFPKFGFPLSKSKSFHPIFIQLGEYVGGHNISAKLDNQPNPPRHS